MTWTENLTTLKTDSVHRTTTFIWHANVGLLGSGPLPTDVSRCSSPPPHVLWASRLRVTEGRSVGRDARDHRELISANGAVFSRNQTTRDRTVRVDRARDRCVGRSNNQGSRLLTVSQRRALLAIDAVHRTYSYYVTLTV